MAITLVNPDGLPKIDVYRQVAVASGSKMVFVAGQVAWDADGVTIGEEISPRRSSSATSTSAPPWPGPVAPSTTWRN